MSSMEATKPVDANDPFEVRKLYKYLRVVDVSDAMDGMGRHDLGLMWPEVRPLWLGMRFWGPALTVRCVPANRHMWPLQTTEEIQNAHGIWFKEMGNVRWQPMIQPGHVVVMDTGGSGEVGFWGSANSMGVTLKGAVGIVTDGYCRDTAEVTLQQTPVCCRARSHDYPRPHPSGRGANDYWLRGRAGASGRYGWLR